MKRASLPSLRIKPELRKAAEEELEQGESRSAFIESSLKTNIEKHLTQKEFIAKGLASRDLARKSGEYVDAALVIDELQGILDKAITQSS
jgi:hypothetical protein